MTDEELAIALKDHRASVVHFSHHACMREGGTFPSDLLNAIDNADQWALSCCVVQPSHQMDLPGSVGIIFEPLSSHVISVSSDDSGSSPLADGTDNSSGTELTNESFKSSLAVMPGQYNEWRVKGAKVAGIYVDDPRSIYVKQKKVHPLPLGDDEVITPTCVDLEFIRQCFPGHQLYTMSPNGLVEI